MWDRWSDRPWKVCLLITLFALPYFLNLGASSLWDSNEAFYAETPREMLESGDYVTPHFNYTSRLQKPPLSYWVVAVFYHLFGVSEFAARLPMALCALVILVLTYAVAARLYGHSMGVSAAMVQAGIGRFMITSRRSVIDMLLLLLVLAALYFFVRLEQDPAARIFWWGFHACLALGTLTKGPVGILLPTGVILLYVTLTRQYRLLRRLRLAWGSLVVAVLVVPWYAVIYQRHGIQAIESFLLLDNLGRYLWADFGPSRGPEYYFFVLLSDSFPWVLFLFPALTFFIQRDLRFFPQSGQRDRSSRARVIFLFSWFAFIFLFFSLSRNKQEYYILPLYPAMAILVARFFEAIVREGPHYREVGTRIWGILTGALLVLLSVAVVLAGRFLALESRAMGLAFVLFAAGTAAVVLSLKGSYRWLYLSLGGGTLLSFALATFAMADLEPYKPVKPLARAILERKDDGDVFGSYRFTAPSLAYYLRAPIFEVHSRDQIVPILKSGKRVFCLMPEEEYQDLTHQGLKLRVLESRPKLYTQLKKAFSAARHGKLPLILLVSNRP